MSGASIVTVFFGLIFVAFGLYKALESYRFTRTALEAEGVVAEVVLVPRGQGSNREHPVIRFKTRDGRDSEFRSLQHYHADVGQKLTMSYDPADPGKAMIGTRASIQKSGLIIATIVCVFGIAVCFMGYAIEVGLFKSNAYRR